MQRHTIRAAGFTATVDAFALDGEQLWLVSMLGSQLSVRALWAPLVKGETAYLSEGEPRNGGEMSKGTSPLVLFPVDALPPLR